MNASLDYKPKVVNQKTKYIQKVVAFILFYLLSSFLSYFCVGDVMIRKGYVSIIYKSCVLLENLTFYKN